MHVGAGPAIPDGTGGISLGDRSLGELLRQARLEAGFSGAQLARLIGRSQPYISDLERGQRTPSLPTLQSIAAALGKPTSFFLDPARKETASTSERTHTPTARGYFLIAAGHVEDAVTARRLSQAMATEGIQSFLFDVRKDLDRDRLSEMVDDILTHALHRLEHTPKRSFHYEDFEGIPRRGRPSREQFD